MSPRAAERRPQRRRRLPDEVRASSGTPGVRHLSVNGPGCSLHTACRAARSSGRPCAARDSPSARTPSTRRSRLTFACARTLSRRRGDGISRRASRYHATTSRFHGCRRLPAAIFAERAGAAQFLRGSGAGRPAGTSTSNALRIERGVDVHLRQAERDIGGHLAARPRRAGAIVAGAADRTPGRGG